MQFRKRVFCHSNLRYAWLASGLILCFAIGSWGVERMVHRAELEGERSTQRIAEAAVEAVRQRIERTLEAVQTLHVIARRIHIDRTGETQRRGAPEAGALLLERHLTELASSERFDVLQLAIIDASGMLVWSTVPGFTPVDLSDRQHFQVHRDGRRQLFISAPLIGRVSGRWSVQVTQAILDEAGDFKGVAVVSLDPVGLSNDLRALDFAPGAIAVLFRADGMVIARSVDAEAAIGRTLDIGDFSRSDSIRTTRMRSEVDGRERIVAWQPLPESSLIVAFGLEYEQVRRSAAELKRMLTLVLFGLLGCGGAGTLLIFAVGDRQRERTAALRAASLAREVTSFLEALPGAAYRGTVTSDGRHSKQIISAGANRTPFGSDDALGAWWRASSKDDPVRNEAFWRTVYAEGEAIREYEVRAPGGRAVWIREHCHVVRDTDSEGRKDVVGLLIDITEERRIKSRAIAASKLATLGEMATGLAHELNQPCASITLAADIAAFELDQGGRHNAEAARRRLDDIAQQAMRMREVVDHFRIFCRTPDGQIGTVAVGDAVRGALKICTGTLKASGIRITLEVPDNLPLVVANLVPLEQVLVNLLVNARDAMRNIVDADKEVAIKAWYDTVGSAVVLTVHDYGTGLAAEASDKVFEPFFTTKPPGEGTGLGLSIAYGIVRGFGGSIDIGNHTEGGAVATLRLKVADSSGNSGFREPVAAGTL